MNRQRYPRSFARVSGAPRIRPRRATSALPHADHCRPGGESSDGAVLTLLSEILIGDSTWTTAEVQQLVVMRDLAELGRWRDDEPDGDDASAS